MKFTPEQRKLIKETREKVKKLEIEQHTLYNNMLKELDMDAQVEDWMFDYVYNSFGSIQNIEALITKVKCKTTDQ
jgi:transcriptional regulator NrdR family protein